VTGKKDPALPTGLSQHTHTAAAVPSFAGAARHFASALSRTNRIALAASNLGLRFLQSRKRVFELRLRDFQVNGGRRVGDGCGRGRGRLRWFRDLLHRRAFHDAGHLVADPRRLLLFVVADDLQNADYSVERAEDVGGREPDRFH